MNSTKTLLLAVSLSTALLLVGTCGMVARSQAPASESDSPVPALPALLPVSLGNLTGVTRGPSDAFEFALSTSPWPVEDWETVRLIAQCESSLDPTAEGALGERGYLQVHPVHQFTTDLFDPSQNLQAGFEVYEEQGFGAWAYCSGGAR